MSFARYRLEIGMVAVCCVLAVLVFYENAAPLPTLNPPALTWMPRPVRVVSGFFGPPSEAAFSVIDERPVFNISRKPVDAGSVPGTPGAATTLAPPDAALIGVIIDSKNQLAMLKEQGSPFAVSLPVGGTLGGWQIAEITADHVVLRAGSVQLTLTMNGARPSSQAQNRLPSTQPVGITPPAQAPSSPMNTMRPAQNDNHGSGL